MKDIRDQKFTEGEIYSVTTEKNYSGKPIMPQNKVYNLFVVTRIYSGSKLLIYPLYRINRHRDTEKPDTIKIACKNKEYDYYVGYKQPLIVKKIEGEVTLEGYIVPDVFKKIQIICFNYLCNKEIYNNQFNLDNEDELLMIDINNGKFLDNIDNIEYTESDIINLSVIEFATKYNVSPEDASKLYIKYMNKKRSK